MRKRIQGRTLSRNATQRTALKRTMLVSLVEFGTIQTTLAKAKELRPFAERMITRAKRIKSGDANSAVVVMRLLRKDVNVKTAKGLIELAKGYKGREGGYTRIIKLAPRKSDAADIAVIEFVKGATKSVVKKSAKSTKVSTKKTTQTTKTKKKSPVKKTAVKSGE